LQGSSTVEQRVVGNTFRYCTMIFICTMSAVPTSNYWSMTFHGTTIS